MDLSHRDTIAAIATARGLGGIGIIRLSGPASPDILRAVFRRGPTNRPVDFAPRRLEYGWVLDHQNRRLDEALAVYMPGPRSFTGEDVAEIHCHGGPAVLEAVLESVLRHGARPAGPGEFTRRACLNRRLDLSRAEAVAELIAAPTLQGAHLARNKLEGRLGNTLETLRRNMNELRALLYAALDFPDLTPQAAEKSEQQKLLNNLRTGLCALVEIHNQTQIWRDGALVVLAGPPNTGKSSLFNALIGRSRALVSDLPGTTRDFLEERLDLEGIPLRLADTAGLRASTDALENAGMERTRALLDEAGAVLLVLEALPPPKLPAIPPLAFENGTLTVPRKPPVLVVLNKIDCFPDQAWPEKLWGCACLPVSALTGQGLPALRVRLAQILTAPSAGLNFDEAAPPSLRQKHQIALALEELDTFALEQEQNFPPEILASRLEKAVGFLDESIGFSCSREVLDQVFSRFCVGK